MHYHNKLIDFDSYKQNNRFYGGLSGNKAGITYQGEHYLIKYPGNLKGRDMKKIVLSGAMSSFSTKYIDICEGGIAMGLFTSKKEKEQREKEDQECLEKYGWNKKYDDDFVLFARDHFGTTRFDTLCMRFAPRIWMCLNEGLSTLILLGQRQLKIIESMNSLHKKLDEQNKLLNALVEHQQLDKTFQR